MAQVVLSRSGHEDHFARDGLPHPEDWPELTLDSLPFRYPERLNAAFELTDAMVARGFGDHVAVIGHGRSRSYRELAEWSNRLAHALVEDFGLRPGNRVLLRSGNNPAFVAAWLAVTKAGGVAVNTMPLLRAVELSAIIDKAEVSLALCDERIIGELHAAARDSRFLRRVVAFDGTAAMDAELDRAALGKPAAFACCDTAADDVALIAFTSGTTGGPKGTMHFHRDLLLIADCFGRDILAVGPNDIAIGTPPLAFTFGLGGLTIFPLRFGAAAVLLEQVSPPELARLIEAHRATMVFTSPTGYRAMMAAMGEGVDLSSLRIAIAGGETLPQAVLSEWIARTGKPIIEGIGSTEMLHIFISNRRDDIVPGSVGRPVAGYEAKIVDADMRDAPDGVPGFLAVRGPTGCRYLADERQKIYVREGWNVTGDTFLRDAAGVFHFIARADDLIVSSGYNIAAPEVEAALLAHPAVLEAAVIAAPDVQRGHVVEAHLVLRPGFSGDDALIRALQDHVKATIAPYKYPRSIRFRDSLPKTATGKLQRFPLRAEAEQRFREQAR